jgi:hypothetical protein
MRQSLEGKLNHNRRPVAKTLLFYAVAFLLILAVNTLPGFKSGPCTPNLDILSLFVTFIVAVSLLIINVIKLAISGRSYLDLTLVHAGVVLIFCTLLAINN